MWLNNKWNVPVMHVVTALVLCFSVTGVRAQKEQYLYEKISSAHTNIHYINEITDSIVKAAGKYIYVTNAAGTGVADLNGDDKPDVFFSSNIGENKLYLNEGDFKFRDVTAEAGVKGNGKWGTGVCMVDINGDGLLDIFIAHSGKYSNPEDLCNEIYVCTGVDAKGVPHYVEKAKEYGLDVPGSQTTQVTFLDYDRDGDLDCFLLNHSNNSNADRLVKNNYLPDTNSRFYCYNLLLRNDVSGEKMHFTDVSKHAGILNSKFNFGLGVVISDFNNDNWPDIFTTSDFTEGDHIYVNNHDGTFTETAAQSIKHGAKNSMGVDAADFNNDLLPDVMNVDMLPDDNYHLKMQLHIDNSDQHDMMLNIGLSNQFPKNMLQLNIGSKNGVPIFAEIAQFAGVSNTNWSWTPLFIDIDNDGWKDMFISNGFYKDYTNQDVQNRYISADRENTSYGDKRLNSCLMLNNKSLGFTNIESWKAEDLMMSYSACEADFDGDGKEDLLINNLNNEVSVLRNTAPSTGNYINIKLREKSKNSYALGAKVYVTCNNLTQLKEMANVRGYQSSQDLTLHFGLGNTNEQVKIRVVWPDGSETETVSAPHTTVTINKEKATKTIAHAVSKSKFTFSNVEKICVDTLRHIENKYNDFKTQFTLPYKLSRNGPGVAQGDINGDGITDFYIGGAAGGERYFMFGQKDGTYTKQVPAAFSLDVINEDVAAAFVDVDGDKDLDLIIISGGVEYAQNPNFLLDRVYANDGKGNFEKVREVFPANNVSKSCVAVADFDGDGKQDLFIGGYTTPGKFEEIPQSFIFRNESDKSAIKFTDATSSVLQGSSKLGMVTSASWVDMDGDKYPELIVTGEWMGTRLFRNQKGVLKEDNKAGLDHMPGLYATVYPTDYNEDGKIDLIVGNNGSNNQFKASPEKPMKIYSIFDTVNKVKPGFLFSYYCKDVEAFASPRAEVLQEFVPYRKIFPNFSSYAKSDVKSFFKMVNLPVPDPTLICTNLLSGVYINQGDGSFKFEVFPDILQTSKVTGVETIDWNYDGKKDYLLTGNFIAYKHQFGPLDAFPAYVLENQGAGKYRVIFPNESGLFIDGQTKKACVMQSPKKNKVLFVRNNDKILLYENKK